MRGPVRSLNGFALLVQQLVKQQQKKTGKRFDSCYFLRQLAKQRRQLKFLDDSFSGFCQSYQTAKSRTFADELHHVESRYAKRSSQRRQAYEDAYARMFFILVASVVQQGYRLEPLSHRALELAAQDFSKKVKE